jgi:formate hydrogenlyase transcriptional activator
MSSETGRSQGMGAELQGSRAAEDPQRLNLELDALLEINRAIGRHLDRDYLFGALAGCLKQVVPTERFGIELPIEGDKLQGHILTPRQPGGQPTQPTVLPALGTVCNWVLQNRTWFISGSRDELRERFPVTFEVMAGEGMESLCALPLASGERCRGALFFMAAARGAYDSLRRGFLEQVASAVAVALDDCLAHEEVRQLRDRLAAEKVYLQEEIRTEHNFEEILGSSPALKKIFTAIEQVAATDSTVLLTGETGTGKELVARAIHNRSRRKDRVLVKVHCAAIPAGLLESELFGHVKGAFTGAVERRVGRFELADRGTLFLDEVGELPPETQVKLLRVLQEQEFEPVGSSKTQKVDVRILAASNRDLEAEVAQGRFRSDLYYRLNVVTLRMPALRERQGDVPLLAMYFMERYSKRFGKRIARVSPRTMDLLVNYAWPGNVRELQNVIERAVVLFNGPELELGPDLLPADTTSAIPPANAPGAEVAEPPEATGNAASLQEVEKKYILAVLKRTRGVVEGPAGAARILNLHPNTLRSRMKKLGLKRQAYDIS